MHRFALIGVALASCTNDAADDNNAADCAPIVGETPFAVGIGPVAVYFPDGRAPGRPVVFASGTSMRGLSISTQTLNADGGAGFSLSDPFCGSRIEGTLVGPTGGIAARVTSNVSGPNTDAPDFRTSDEVYCASSTGLARVAEIEVVGPESGPSGTLTLRSKVPLDPTSHATIRLDVDGVDVPLMIADQGGILHLTPRAALPRGKTLSLDLRGLRDVMRRDPGAGVITRALAHVTAEVTDLTFAAPPPSGSVIPNGVTSGGKLTFARSNASFGSTPLRVLIGVGGATSNTRIRVRHRLLCAGSESATASIVASDGQGAALTVACADAVSESSATLVGPPPWAIFVSSRTPVSLPCNYPDHTTAPGYEIDDVAFE